MGLLNKALLGSTISNIEQNRLNRNINNIVSPGTSDAAISNSDTIKDIAKATSTSAAGIGSLYSPIYSNLSSNITKNGMTYKRLNPMLYDGKNIYNTFLGTDGNYYLYDGTDFIKTSDNVSNILKNNIKAEYNIDPKTYDFVNASSKSNSGGGSGSGYGSGGGYYNGSGKGTDKYLEELLNEYKQKLDALENPKVWTADELVKHYNMEDQYDYDRILNMYNNATDKYYRDAIATQEAINKDMGISNALYADSLLRSYLNSYKNAAPTAVGKGTRAANALSTMLSSDLINEEAATGLNDVVNQYKENWKYELANNPTLARDRYNDIAKWLLTQGVNTNTAEVQDYINSLNAYDTAYSGIRNAQNNLASTAAQAYKYRTDAALAQNAYAASNADSNVLMNAYKLKYGNTDNAWQKAYNNTRGDVSTVYTQSSSAK